MSQMTHNDNYMEEETLSFQVPQIQEQHKQQLHSQMGHCKGSQQMQQSQYIEQEQQILFSNDRDDQYIQELICQKRSDNSESYFVKVTCGETAELSELLKHFQVLNELKKSSQFTTLAPSKCANFSNKNDSFFLLQVGPSIENLDIVFSSIDCKIEAIKSLIFSIYSIHNNDMIHTQILPANLLFLKSNIQQRFQLQCFPFLQYCPCQQTVEQQRYIFGPIHTFTAPEIRELANNKPSKISDPFKSDIFSLGCMIYFILTGGKLPFISSATQQDFLYKNSYEQPSKFMQDAVKNALNSIKYDISQKFPQDIIKALEIFSSFMNLISQCLLPNPSERPAINSIYNHDFINSF